MPWFPSYESEGLFSPYIPAGTMTSLMDICKNNGNHWAIGDESGGYYESWSKAAGGFIKWSNYFGCDFKAKLIGLIKSHINETVSGVTMAEVTVLNPEGAQYYKQTLTLIGGYRVTELRHKEMTYQGDVYKLDYVNAEVSITDIYRREYPTPYSTPVSTRIMTSSTATTFGVVISGDYQCEPSQYFFDKGVFCLSPYEYNDKNYIGMGFYTECIRGNFGDEVQNASGTLIGLSETRWRELFGADLDETDDPNEDPDPDDDEGEGGESGEGGGEGDHNKRQDPVPYPDDPPIGGAGAGFITLYRMSQANMVNFAKKMFEADIMKALKDFFADPLDMICGIMIVPFSPETSGSAKPVVHMVSPLPDIEWDRFYPVITDQYQDIDCGSIDIGSFYDSCFSYNPYTRYMIWLPYIGYRDLDPDEVTGHTIHVKYKVDCMTGDCVAFIMTTSISMPGMVPVTQCIAQYSGNCGVRVAFGRQSFDSAIQASIQLATGLVGGAVRGAGSAISAFVAGQAGAGSSNEGDTLAEGQMAQSAGAASSAISMPTVAAMKTHVIKSGVSGSNAGYISVQTPHVIMFVPRQSRPENYRHIKGYPANLAGPISDGFLGYLEIENIQLDGITATSTEKSEIAAILRGGVLYGNA